jgi:hypothetical protein
MARPATGQTPVKTFRPPGPLWNEVEEIAAAEGRKNSDAVIEALHDWVKKKRREHAAAERAPAAPTEEEH